MACRELLKTGYFRFQFPVTFSSDLHKVLLAGYHVTVLRNQDMSGSGASMEMQCKNFDPWFSRRHFGENGCEFNAEFIKFYTFATWFSPCGHYLLLVRPYSLDVPPNLALHFNNLELSVFRAFPGPESLECVSTLTPGQPGLLQQMSKRLDRLSDFSRWHCFHPQYPIIAFSSSKNISLWHFCQSGNVYLRFCNPT
jgi:hypothetical protein